MINRSGSLTRGCGDCVASAASRWSAGDRAQANSADHVLLGRAVDHSGRRPPRYRGPVQGQKPARSADARAPATARTPKTPRPPAAGFIGNPHATPQCSIADFSADDCPIDSQIGDRRQSSPAARTCRSQRALQPRSAARRRRSDSPSRSSSSIRRSSPCSPRGPAATTASTRRRPRSTTAGPSRLTPSRRSSGGCRPIRSTTRCGINDGAPIRRFRAFRSYGRLCDADGAAQHQRSEHGT